MVAVRLVGSACRWSQSVSWDYDDDDDDDNYDDDDDDHNDDGNDDDNDDNDHADGDDDDDLSSKPGRKLGLQRRRQTTTRSQQNCSPLGPRCGIKASAQGIGR